MCCLKYKAVRIQVVYVQKLKSENMFNAFISWSIFDGLDVNDIVLLKPPQTNQLYVSYFKSKFLKGSLHGFFPLTF